MKPSEALFPILLAGTACSSGPERPETMYYYDQDEDGFGDEALPRTYQEKVCAPNEKLVLTLTGCDNGVAGDKFDGEINITYTKDSFSAAGSASATCFS